MTSLKSIGVVVAGLALSLGAGMARADVVAVVSAKSPVGAISRDQVMDIFLGKSSHFPDGSLAVPIDLTESSPTREEFYLKFAGKSPAQLKAHWSKIIFTGRGQPPKEVASPAAMKKRLLDDPGAIGYVEQGEVDGSLRVLMGK
jgi:ABC-type phosphate transport system substrate-binding protein